MMRDVRGSLHRERVYDLHASVQKRVKEILMTLATGSAMRVVARRRRVGRVATRHEHRLAATHRGVLVRLFEACFPRFSITRSLFARWLRSVQRWGPAHANDALECVTSLWADCAMRSWPPSATSTSLPGSSIGPAAMRCALGQVGWHRAGASRALESIPHAAYSAHISIDRSHMHGGKSAEPDGPEPEGRRPHSADCHATLAVISRHARIAMRH